MLIINYSQPITLITKAFSHIGEIVIEIYDLTSTTFICHKLTN